MSSIQEEPVTLSRDEAERRCNLGSLRYVIPIKESADEWSNANRYLIKREMGDFLRTVLRRSVFVVVFGVLWAILWDFDFSLCVLMGLLFLLITPALVLQTYWKLLSEEKKTRKRMEQGDNLVMPPGYIVLSPEGYACIHEDRSESWRWAAVPEVVQVDRALLLINASKAVHLVLQCMFESPEKFAEFTAVLMGYYNEGRKTAASTQGSPPS